MNDTKSARRYARAVLETATRTADVRDELAAIAGAMRAHPALLDALTHPGIPNDKKKAIVTSVFQGMAAPLPRLLDMLVDASRVELIQEIAVRYGEEWKSRNNVHAAKVVSAVPLTDEARRSVQSAIEGAVSGVVEMEITTDSTLVGGLRVEVDGHVFDGSVKARLKALRQHLCRPGPPFSPQ